MRLITKTMLFYIAVTLLLFVAGGGVFYFNLKRLVDEEVTESLYISKDRVINYVKVNDSLPSEQFLFRGKYSIVAANGKQEELRDTLLFDESEDEYLSYRILQFPVKVNGIDKTVLVSLPLFEYDDLIETIGIILILISLALIIIFIVSGNILSRRLWKPFFKTLKLIGNYQGASGTPLKSSKTGTKEFTQLNDAIEKMSEKIETNFCQLRSFTENASHEMQTPIAAIRLETEQLMQNPDLSMATLESLNKVNQSASRLGKVLQSLLLLAKIGNNQFLVSDVDISKLLMEKVDAFSDRMTLMDLNIEKDIEKGVIVQSSPELAAIAISNLLSNAMRHNTQGGIIRISLTAEFLKIENSGDPLPFDSTQLFGRFVRNIGKKDSTGLGLALVKEIADKNNWEIGYSFNDGMHVFKIIFRR